MIPDLSLSTCLSTPSFTHSQTLALAWADTAGVGVTVTSALEGPPIERTVSQAVFWHQKTPPEVGITSVFFLSNENFLIIHRQNELYVHVYM